jgi:ABC-type sugar transport system ATPase subunit
MTLLVRLVLVPDLPALDRLAIVEARGVAKRYGGAQALTGVDLVVDEGSVHALVGENGAGKSTLGKILSGLVAPSAGTVGVRGQITSRLTPRDAIRHGITIIEQELTLLGEHDVATNVFLGTEPRRHGLLDRRALERQFTELQQRVGCALRADARVRDLRTADRQKVEILRALARDARLIVMDEPTAALTRDESRLLLDIIRRLRDDGTAVIFVSHNITDVLDVADTVTILKDGRVVRTGPAAAETVDSVVEGMLGRTLGSSFPDRPPAPTAGAPVVLSVRGLTRTGIIEDITFDLHAGEILGMGGLVGSGRSEVARAIGGADPLQSGTIELDGRPCTVRSPRDAIALGIASVPESRQEQGLLMGHSVGRNLMTTSIAGIASHGIVRRRRERERVAAIITQLDIRPPAAGIPIALLSGGNQQKVLFGKWLVQPPKVLIADEPTRGVDVGARRAIYDLIAKLAGSGTAVLLISSELEEVMHLSHRILVMRAGRVAGEFAGDASEDELMRSALAAGPRPITGSST